MLFLQQWKMQKQETSRMLVDLKKQCLCASVCVCVWERDYNAFSIFITIITFLRFNITHSHGHQKTTRAVSTRSMLRKIGVKKCKKWSFHKYYVCLYNKRGLTNNYEAGSSSGVWSYKIQDRIYLGIDGQPLVYLYLIMPFT